MNSNDLFFILSINLDNVVSMMNLNVAIPNCAEVCIYNRITFTVLHMKTLRVLHVQCKYFQCVHVEVLVFDL